MTSAPAPVAPPRFRRPRFAIRATDLARRQDTFLVVAICSVLGNRTFLIITGYPQLGNGTLHISHAIWGALMMAIAVILAISYLDPSTRRFVAILGGAGFGWFIDELGKFITRDVNYFFEPTIALIYLTFVGMYLSFRSIQRRNYSTDEAIANALEAIKTASVGKLDEPTRLEAIALLRRTGATGGIADRVSAMLVDAPALPPAAPSRFATLTAAIRARYLAWTERPRFSAGVDVAFVVLGAVGVANVVAVALDGPGITTFPERVTVITSVISWSCYIIGVVLLRRRGRADAYRWFDRGLLVNIYVTQVFVFAEEQLSGVIGLVVALVVWIVLRSAMKVERERVMLAATR